ncbi:MAG: hypothetical protein M3Q58_02140 [Bacteroidota bacterium]|nr:hypothetical protein [Bacteroidota bacterium]
MNSFKHSFIGDLNFKTDSIISINLVSEDFMAVYPDSVIEYSKHIVKVGKYLQNQEVELREIKYITIEPHIFTTLILIGAAGLVGTVITPLIALNYRNFTFNKNRYVTIQTPCLIAAICLPVSFIFEKRKLRVR